MKFAPEVIAALETLRKSAENDFERHRINVLENDLTQPPKVEIIDDKHQKFLDTVYCRNKKNRFTLTKFIHREVWQYCRGDIPRDYDIHHIDKNPANNELSNLQCLTKIEHTQTHRNPIIEKICANCGKVFQTKRSVARFCSISCAAQNQYKGHVIEKVCPVCREKFSTIAQKTHNVARVNALQSLR